MDKQYWDVDQVRCPANVERQALAPDLAHAFFSTVTSPKQELWLTSEGQIDFYDDPKLIAPAADAVAAFLRGL